MTLFKLFNFGQKQLLILRRRVRRNTKTIPFRSWIVRILSYSLMVLVVACSNLPGTGVPPAPPSSNEPILKPEVTSTLQPIRVTLRPPTKIPFPTITDTALPPLPDFDRLLSFAVGGGNDPGCMQDPGYRPAFTVERIWLCLWGVVSLGSPFRLEFISPDGRTFQSNNLWVDPHTQADNWLGYLVHWEGYPGFDQIYELRGSIVNIFMFLPPNPASGQWQVLAHGDGFQMAVDFNLQRGNVPSITALDPHSGDEIFPVDYFASDVFRLHPVKLKDDGKVDVIGINYPAKVPIYILLYQETPGRKFTLIHNQSVFSDSNGLISAELSGPFEPGQSYVVYGLSDPNTDLRDVSNIAYADYFKVMSSSVTSNINTSNPCPGAPAQRMAVNQRGYVSTQSVPVRLRDAPATSANVVTELPTGSQFTVIGGPSCSENWSWWQVQTDDGVKGWLSEGGDQVDPYFISPLH